MTERQACGTYLGLRLHIQLAEPLCPPCAEQAMSKSLLNERRNTIPSRREQNLRDLRAIIALLAQLMSTKAGAP
jgi:hypothetical protein